MGILSRFGDIISANINDLLDKAEDPAKMVDQYLRDMMEDLAEVKQEAAGVMAEESRTKRLVDENAKEVSRYQELAKRALLAGNEDDARVLLSKKQELENTGASLQTAYAAAHGSRMPEYPEYVTPEYIEQAVVEYLSDYYAGDWYPFGDD